jgi:hypothetical protein
MSTFSDIFFGVNSIFVLQSVLEMEEFYLANNSIIYNMLD